MRTAAEILIVPVRSGELRISNPLARTHAIGDVAFVELLADPGASVRAGWRCRAVDATVSPVADGLLGDPTGLDRAATLRGAPELDRATALKLAAKLRLVYEDEVAHADFLDGPRRTVVDLTHRGTVHDMVAEDVLLRRRLRDLDAWWVAQKFTDDLREPREGLYRDVQWPFALERWGGGGRDGQRVLDFGCGPGLFSRLLAASGARVLGLDTNQPHLDAARALADADGLAPRTEFRLLELPLERALASLGHERFDLVVLSDVLMFYFHPYGTRDELDPVALLTGLRERLAPGGTIEILEPQGTFWQQPWLGSEERPLTVLGEYRHARHRVTPTLEQVSRAAEAAGLVISQVRELVPPDGLEPSRARAFAAEFPLWWFFELRAR